MFYKVMEPDEFLTQKDTNHEIVDILDNNGAHLKLIYVKKDEGFDSHMSNTNACIYLLEGEVELSFSPKSMCGCNICGTQISADEKENRIYKIKKGKMFLFEKDIIHSLKALKNSTFLYVKI